MGLFREGLVPLHRQVIRGFVWEETRASSQHQLFQHIIKGWGQAAGALCASPMRLQPIAAAFAKLLVSAPLSVAFT